MTVQTIVVLCFGTFRLHELQKKKNDRTDRSGRGATRLRSGVVTTISARMPPALAVGRMSGKDLKCAKWGLFWRW